MDDPQDLAKRLYSLLKSRALDGRFTNQEARRALAGQMSRSPSQEDVDDALQYLVDRLIIRSPDGGPDHEYKPFRPERPADCLQVARLQASEPLSEAQDTALQNMVQDGSRRWKDGYMDHPDERTPEALRRKGVLQRKNFGDSNPRSSGLFAAGRFEHLMRRRASLG